MVRALDYLCIGPASIHPSLRKHISSNAMLELFSHRSHGHPWASYLSLNRGSLHNIDGIISDLQRTDLISMDLGCARFERLGCKNVVAWRLCRAHPVMIVLLQALAVPWVCCVPELVLHTVCAVLPTSFIVLALHRPGQYRPVADRTRR